ncbi:membrane protein, partial [Nephila pilipes]
MNAVVGSKEVIDLNNNSSDLDALNGQPNLQRESFATSEKQERPVATLEEQESVSNLKKIGADFSIPLSIFHYKDYNSDFFTSWYNISSRIFKEINQACPEKQVLNLALSVLMFPYIVFTALGLVIYNKFKTNDKTQISSEENKTKKSEVSESTAKRLAYGVLAAVAILVSIPILLLLLIPATPALATFYLLNRDLSHSLVAVLKVSSGSYQKKHQNIEVSFREIDAGKSDIMWDMEVKFPPQFKQLLRDLYEDPEHNAVLKLSAKIDLKNGLKPLRNEIKNVLATSIQEFAKAMEELMKLEKKEITYDKLKELLNEFRLKVVDSIGPNLTSHLIQNAYQVAFIQAIKFAQKRREDFLLERALEEVLIKEELKSQGKELPSEKEMIIKDLKVSSDLGDNVLPLFRAKWKDLIQEGKIAKRTIINTYEDMYPQETKKALDNAEREIKDLREIGQKRYNGICEKLKEIHGDIGKSNLTDGILRRKLEDLFKLELTDQAIYQKLIKSRIKEAKIMLNQSDLTIDIRQSLLDEFCNLNVNVCSH